MPKIAQRCMERVKSWQRGRLSQWGAKGKGGIGGVSFVAAELAAFHLEWCSDIYI